MNSEALNPTAPRFRALDSQAPHNEAGPQQVAPPRLLDREEVSKLLNIGGTTIYHWMKTEGFPKPIRLSERSVRWFESEVMEWLHSRERGGA